MSRSIRLFVLDMIEACDSIFAYTAGIGPAELAGERMRIDAVIRNIEILGEAAKHVPAPIRELAPVVPWSEIAGMRDIVIHGYFGIDVDIVCDVAFTHVRPLQTALSALLAQLPEEA